jgi:hypothetical protein
VNTSVEIHVGQPLCEGCSQLLYGAPGGSKARAPAVPQSEVAGGAGWWYSAREQARSNSIRLVLLAGNIQKHAPIPNAVLEFTIQRVHEDLSIQSALGDCQMHTLQ